MNLSYNFAPHPHYNSASWVWVQLSSNAHLVSEHPILGILVQCLRFMDLKNIMHLCKCLLLRHPTWRPSLLFLLLWICFSGQPWFFNQSQSKTKIHFCRGEHSEEGRYRPVKKQKIRTALPQTQLHVLSERFHGQKYLSLLQMQEHSNILNLNYNQVKTWFQNQRMKCKNSNWPENSNSVTQSNSTATEHPGFSSCHQR